MKVGACGRQLSMGMGKAHPNFIIPLSSFIIMIIIQDLPALLGDAVVIRAGIGIAGEFDLPDLGGSDEIGLLDAEVLIAVLRDLEIHLMAGLFGVVEQHPRNQGVGLGVPHEQAEFVPVGPARYEQGAQLVRLQV